MSDTLGELLIVQRGLRERGISDDSYSPKAGASMAGASSAELLSKILMLTSLYWIQNLSFFLF